MTAGHVLLQITEKGVDGSESDRTREWTWRFGTPRLASGGFWAIASSPLLRGQLRRGLGIDQALAEPVLVLEWENISERR